MVQWLKLSAPNAQGLGLVPGQGARSHAPTKILHVAAATNSSHAPTKILQLRPRAAK